MLGKEHSCKEVMGIKRGDIIRNQIIGLNPAREFGFSVLDKCWRLPNPMFCTGAVNEY